MSNIYENSNCVQRVIPYRKADACVLSGANGSMNDAMAKVALKNDAAVVYANETSIRNHCANLVSMLYHGDSKDEVIDQCFNAAVSLKIKANEDLTILNKTIQRIISYYA